MKSGVSTLTLVSDCFQFAYCLSPTQCHMCGWTSWPLVPYSILFNKYTTFDLIFAFISWWTLVFFHLWWLYILLLQIPAHNFLFDCHLLNLVCIFLISGDAISTISYLSKHQVVFQSYCFSLYSHQCCAKDPNCSTSLPALGMGILLASLELFRPVSHKWVLQIL